MLWFFYNLLFAMGYLLIMPRFLFRMWKRGGYRKDFSQRFGHYSADTLQRLSRQSRIWIHAVSVGEVHVAMRFMSELRRRRPAQGFVLTTTTSTGHRIAEKGISGNDVLLYFPVDFPVVMRRVLSIIKPAAVLLVEGELWPNLIRSASQRNIPVMLINGRTSPSSYWGYRKLRVFFGRVLRCMNLLLAQSETDAERLLDIGAAADRVKVMGSAKYDVAGADPAIGQRTMELLKAAGMGEDKLLLVGGSTWPGEESVLCEVYKRLRGDFENVRLVLVPRHAERRAEVESDISRVGLTWKRRSELSAESDRPIHPQPEVLLVDTTGELPGFYAAATVIFVGKSLKSHGGQNVIEPAALGKPVIVGPFMENFLAVMDDFRSTNAVVQIKDEPELEPWIRKLLADKELRAQYGDRSLAVVRKGQGWVSRSVDLILAIMDQKPSI